MGFCMGVERAVSIVQQIAELKDEQKVVTLGPIIHNQQTVDKFTHKGIGAVNSVENIHEGKVIIRAHGIPPSERLNLEEKGIEIVDGTCPKVIASHKIVQKYCSQGYHIVIVGDRNHGEIKGLAGYAENFDIIETPEEAALLSLPQKTMVICQTTIKENEFFTVCDVLKKKNSEIKIHNSICSATNKRQVAVKELVEKVEAVVVIGGKNSANTQRLYLTVKEMGKPCWHIEDAQQIPIELTQYETIGLTAGASTPDWVIEEVEKILKAL
jgi:4-hydroxy-3-methylbut-2-enyl diphosphate reductase